MSVEMSFVVNKSGSNMSVYNLDNTHSSRTKIGTIYKRETYIISHISNNGLEIWFRNSSGVLTFGYLDHSDGWIGVDSFAKYIQNYPYDSVTRQMYCRSSRKIYISPGGTQIGVVNSGKCVILYNSSESGGASEAYFDYPNGVNNPPKVYLRISKYKNSSGEWVVTQNGYIDASLEYASGYNSIRVYGSW